MDAFLDAFTYYNFNRLTDIRWNPLPYVSFPAANLFLTPAQSSPTVAFPLIASILAICLLAIQTTNANLPVDTVLAAHLFTFLATIFCTQVPASLALDILSKSLLIFFVARAVPRVFASVRFLRQLVRAVVEIGILAWFAWVVWALWDGEVSRTVDMKLKAVGYTW